MTKYIKTTDHTGKDDHTGYHSVGDDFKLPLSTENETFAFVDEKDARENHPDLFGPAKAAKKASAE